MDATTVGRASTLRKRQKDGNQHSQRIKKPKQSKTKETILEPIVDSQDRERFQQKAEQRAQIPIRIGYPCINWTQKLTTGHTFRMANHSKQKLVETVNKNLSDLEQILQWNQQKGLKFFRIGSGFIPFASHSKFQNSLDWESHFKERFQQLGNFIKSNSMRISMHPDQFVVLNSLKVDIVERSIEELTYHCRLLDAFELDSTHKVQLHVGGIFGNKEESKQRFIQEYNRLNPSIKKRLVIENDDRLYSLKDCLEIHNATGVPILFDNLHHDCLNNGETLKEAVVAAHATWDPSKDGLPLMDYSSQQPGEKKGKHGSSIAINHWTNYLQQLQGLKFDVMLEIKDKEASALKAVEVLENQYT